MGRENPPYGMTGSYFKLIFKFSLEDTFILLYFIGV